MKLGTVVLVMSVQPSVCHTFWALQFPLITLHPNVPFVLIVHLQFLSALRQKIAEISKTPYLFLESINSFLELWSSSLS